MKKIGKVIISFLLVISIGLCFYQVVDRISSHNILNKNDIRIERAANYLAALKNKITGDTSGVIVDNVKRESNSMDNQQLNVSSIKKIVLKSKERVIYGLYLNDSIITADDYGSNRLRITNIINGNTRTSIFPDKAVDYTNCTVLTKDDQGYCLYNVEQNKIGHIPSGNMTKPSFIDDDGNYILCDDGQDYCLVDRNTDKVYKLLLRQDKKNYKFKQQPCVTASDDRNSIFYDNGTKILKCSVVNSYDSREVYDLSKYCREILSMVKIKGENAVVVKCADKDDKITCRYVNFSTHEVKELLNPVNELSPHYKIKSNKVGTVNRIVYEEKTKNNEFRICIGEIKNGDLIKTTDVVKMNYNDSRDLVWSAYWNDDATRLYISMNNNSGGNRNDYLVDIN